ncbi:MAG: hypothetical protein KDH09_11345 [Chrysiogenetes bacterium]|nr:hypothetical protein [Chrysiogenetes bacterium]
MATQRRRLGEILVDAGVIDEFQLRSALADQQRWGARLGTTLVKLGFVTEEVMAKALSSQLKIPNVNLRTTDIPAEVVKIVAVEKAEKHGIIPVMLKEEGNRKVLYLAMSDPANLGVLDELQFATGHMVKPVIAMESQIQDAIRRYYHGGPVAESGIESEGKDELQPIPMRLAPDAARPQHEPKSELTHREEVTLSADGKMEGRDDGRPRPSKEMLALLRLLSRKGLITKEEFIEEFKNL